MRDHREPPDPLALLGQQVLQAQTAALALSDHLVLLALAAQTAWLDLLVLLALKESPAQRARQDQRARTAPLARQALRVL